MSFLNRLNYIKGAVGEIFLAEMAREQGYEVYHTGGEWGGSRSAPDLLLIKNQTASKVEIKLRVFHRSRSNIFDLSKIENLSPSPDYLIVFRIYRKLNASNHSSGFYACCFRREGNKWKYFNSGNPSKEIEIDAKSCVDLSNVSSNGLSRWLGINFNEKTGHAIKSKEKIFDRLKEIILAFDQ